MGFQEHQMCGRWACELRACQGEIAAGSQPQGAWRSLIARPPFRATVALLMRVSSSKGRFISHCRGRGVV